MAKVSVIIPFYNVGAFIERCARSLMAQTLQDAEFIFVDDASPDNSADILRNVLAEYDRDARIVVHERNLGLPAARNTGLAQAKGEFICHCDSDDWMEPTMLEDLYSAAAGAGADFAYCDFYIDFGDSRRHMPTPDYPDAETMVKEGFLAGMMKYNVWNKLVRRELYERPSPVLFPAGHSMGEDMTMIALGLRSKGVARVAKPLYHYMKTNAGAFTNTFSERHLADIEYNAGRTLEILQDMDIPDRELYMALFKLNIKLPFLFSCSYSQYRLWHSWYPESNAYIGRNNILPARTVMVQKWARMHLFPLVWLYAFAVNRVYYGLIHREK
ncbi:MAG: glycosyltransferase family 2 protein [Bacteroidales bacterium]|nr:glycosyltransferase family 2 protein [Bacteroidales bacterium]